MNIINISNAPAYTSPNSMTLICTEKPDGSTNFATLAFWAFASTNPGKIMFPILRLWHSGLLRPPIPERSCSP